MNCSLSERRGPAARGPALWTFVLLGLGCRAAVPAGELAIASRTAGGITTYTLRPAPGVRINARAAPAIEFADGRVLRLSSPAVTADSAYFAAPPTGSVPAGGSARGLVRASICRPDERVCRGVVVPLSDLDDPEADP